MEKSSFVFSGSTSCCLFSHYLVFLLKQFCQGRKQQADTEKLLFSPVIRLRASFPFVPTPSPSLSSRHHPRPAKYYYNYTLYCFYLFFRHPQLFSALSSFTCLSSSVYGCPSPDTSIPSQISLKLEIRLRFWFLNNKI